MTTPSKIIQAGAMLPIQLYDEFGNPDGVLWMQCYSPIGNSGGGSTTPAGPTTPTTSKTPVYVNPIPVQKPKITALKPEYITKPTPSITVQGDWEANNDKTIYSDGWTYQTDVWHDFPLGAVTAAGYRVNGEGAPDYGWHSLAPGGPYTAPSNAYSLEIALEPGYAWANPVRKVRLLGTPNDQLIRYFFLAFYGAGKGDKAGYRRDYIVLGDADTTQTELDLTVCTDQFYGNPPYNPAPAVPLSDPELFSWVVINIQSATQSFGFPITITNIQWA